MKKTILNFLMIALPVLGMAQLPDPNPIPEDGDCGRGFGVMTRVQVADIDNTSECPPVTSEFAEGYSDFRELKGRVAPNGIYAIKVDISKNSIVSEPYINYFMTAGDGFGEGEHLGSSKTQLQSTPGSDKKTVVGYFHMHENSETGNYLLRIRSSKSFLVWEGGAVETYPASAEVVETEDYTLSNSPSNANSVHYIPNQDCSNLRISQFKLGDFIKNSGCPADVMTFSLASFDRIKYLKGYSNFTEETITLTAGETHPIAVQITSNYQIPTLNANALVWLDKNGDERFDTDEMIKMFNIETGVEDDYGNFVYTSLEPTFTVPANMPPGEYRLRVRANNMDSFNSYMGIAGFNLDLDEGETEDYTVRIVAPSSTGINELEKTTLTIYPNPTLNVLNFDSSSEIYSVSVFNLNGQEIISNDNVENNQISVADLAPGIYMVHSITVDGQLSVNKMIKE